MQTFNERLLLHAEEINSIGILDGQIRFHVLQMLNILRPEVEKERKIKFERDEAIARDNTFRREARARHAESYGEL